MSISPAAEVLRDEPADPLRSDFLDAADAEDPLEPPAPVQRPIPGLFAAGMRLVIFAACCVRQVARQV